MTRTSLVRAIATCTALGLLLGACGHYGPPVRPKPKPAPAESPQPADEDRERDEH